MQQQPRPPQQSRPPYNVQGAHQVDEATANAARSWRNKYRTPSQLAPDRADYVTVQSQIGHVWLLEQVEPGSSASKGPFVRFVGRELDPETGEILSDAKRVIAFAQTIRRFAEQLAGGELTGLLVLNPPVAVKVAAEGDVVLFVDP